MGLLDLFKPQSKTPMVQSILPDAAVQEILRGRLPILNTNKIFLKSGEVCHYIDKAIYEKKTVRKRYVRRNSGYPNHNYGSVREIWRSCFFRRYHDKFLSGRTEKDLWRWARDP